MTRLLWTFLVTLSCWSLAEHYYHVHAQDDSESGLKTRRKQLENDKKILKRTYLFSSSPLQKPDPLSQSAILDYLQSTRTNMLTHLYQLQQQYSQLPPKLKFTAGTVTGFVATKIVLGTAFKMIKVVGAAYLITEVLHSMGLLEDLPIPTEGRQWIWKAREELVNTIQLGRESLLKRRIHVEAFQTCVDNDRMTTFGFVTGMFVSLIS